MLESLKYKNSCPTCRDIIFREQDDNNGITSDIRTIMEADEIINNINEEELNEPTEFISRESITSIKYFLHILYIQQITYNIFFGISYGFGVGCGFISSMLIFYKIFKN